MGTPKALVHGTDGESWLVGAVRALASGGCSEVTVVLGAAWREAVDLVPQGIRIEIADDWDTGMAASLRTGLRSLSTTSQVAALVHLVDLPDVGADVVRRVLDHGTGPDSLIRAAYGKRPGHPVLIGRAHWSRLESELTGDQGARAYLRRHRVGLVECGDLADGQDVDRCGDRTGKTAEHDA